MVGPASSHEEGDAIFPISQIRKLRHKEIKQLPEGHATTKCQNQVLNSGCPTLKCPSPSTACTAHVTPV